MNVVPRYRLEKCHRERLFEGSGAKDGPASPAIQEAWRSLFRLPMPDPRMAAVIMSFPTGDVAQGEWWHHDGKFGEMKYKVVKWCADGEWAIDRIQFRRSPWSAARLDGGSGGSGLLGRILGR